MSSSPSSSNTPQNAPKNAFSESQTAALSRNADPSEDAGLPMSPKWDSEKLAQEIRELNQLTQAPFLPKVCGYVRRTGPGLLQSAMTLGAGSATASVVAGASFGYKLLWVQPLAMLLGVVMLGALSNIVLTSGERPYRSFGREFSREIVFLWAFGTIFASIIWHFPQYTLLAGAGRDLVEHLGPWTMANANGITPAGYAVSFLLGLFVLGMNIIMVYHYGTGSRGVKFYERFLRIMIALVIILFLIVVLMNVRQIEWLELMRGFCGYYGFPKNAKGIVETDTYIQVFGMLSASVGINMTFLYPYSLLAKGWGKDHRTLAKWDLGMTMFLPFVLVTSLIIVSMSVTGVYHGIDGVQSTLKPLEAANAFAGIPFGTVIFCLGLIGMCGGAISTHMVVCGFTFCEMLGIKMTPKRFRLFAMVPAIGILGVVVPLPLWFPVIASAVCGTLLPIAYLTFFVLNNKRSFIGDAVGSGWKRWIINLFLVLALAVTVLGAWKSLNALSQKIFPQSAAPAVSSVEPVSDSAPLPPLETPPPTD